MSKLLQVNLFGILSAIYQIYQILFELFCSWESYRKNKKSELFFWDTVDSAYFRRFTLVVF